MESVRAGENPELTTRQKHTRECYVVAEAGADLARIEREIKTMPNYFDEYDTTVHFISEEELQRDHAGLPHGGFVIRSGKTGDGTHKHIIEYRLSWTPIRVHRLGPRRLRACGLPHESGRPDRRKTMLDIAPAYLCAQSGEELRAHLL